jgi:DNA-binding IclR family transcriptional regulator
VLLAVARDPDLRVREIAEAAEITERYAYRVLSDLQKAGYVHRDRRGRCNRYRVTPALLRLSDRSAGGDLVATLSRRQRPARSVIV